MYDTIAGMAETSPRVSISIPVYNGAETIRATLESALEQTYTDCEIVIVDNASTDTTRDIIREYGDPRIALHVNPRNLGFLRNHNRSVELARGEFIKPLHADDRLLPSCVERMVEVFDRHERVGLVFAPRRIEIAGESDADLRAWREHYATAYQHFPGLGPVNDGPTLLAHALRADLVDNWVGEPSCLMYRRSAVERVGLYSPNVHAFNDFDMSVRLMSLFDVGFIDEELTIYRRSHGSIIDALKVNAWLDRLWVLEGLAADPEVRQRNPEVMPALRRAQVEVARMALRTARRRPELLARRMNDLRRYAGYRARRAARLDPQLVPVLPPAA